MVKLGQNDPELSSAIETGNGKLEIKNEHALIQIKGVLAALSQSLAPHLRTAVRTWVENEETLNKGAKGGYQISWKKLIAILEQTQAILEQFRQKCPDFQEYILAVETGEIVPSPTPPPTSTIVAREQGTVQSRVAGIYGGRRPMGGVAPRRNSSGSMARVIPGKTTTGGEKK